MPLNTKQQNVIGAIIDQINNIVKGMQLSEADASDSSKFIQIIVDINSENPEEMKVATKLSDNSDPGLDATLIQEMKRTDNKPGPTVQIFGVNASD